MNRAIENEADLTREVALFSSKNGYLAVQHTGGWMSDDDDYVRVSEPLEVTFTPLPDEVVLASRVDAIDEEIKITRAKFTKTLDDLKDQKQRLLAITHEEVSDV